MRLRDEDLDFMLHILDLSSNLRDKLEEPTRGTVQLTLDDADMLRDLCGERLQTHGWRGPE